MARNDRVDGALGKHGYVQVRKVGEGSFGAAILVQHTSERDRGTQAIVKMIDLSRASKQEREDALKESQVLASLKHPYIVRYRESFSEDGWVCIVMDYCEGGDLSDRVKKMRQSGKSFPQEQVVRWFTQAILALKYIHDLHILHRDLKSGNFFLSKSGNLKMGDFGIAKVLECTAACAQTQIGTPYYLSPEICQGKPYAWSSDIWAMGCILYELLARRVPFDAPDLKSLIQRITRGPTPEAPAEYTLPLRTLCKDMLDRDPAKRLPAADILKRPVVQEMVRRMLDEVKTEEDAAVMREQAPDARPSGSSGGSAPSGAPRPAPSAAAGRYGGTAGNYSRNDAVEYYSETHSEWLPASVTGVDTDGRIMLNVKPNVWLSFEVQAVKVRPRQGSQQPSAPAAAARPSSVSRLPAPGPAAVAGAAVVAPPPGNGGSPSRPSEARRPASERRTPLAGDAGIARNPSRDALPVGQAAARLMMPGAPDRGDYAGGAAAAHRGPSRDRLAGRGAPPRREAVGTPFRAAGIPSRGG